ncbi:MAG TPA: tetratricopeptide repeat protein, partial [Terriglobia bacterium]|nr:tetratricopeptide repeat protein [Terriglobia bacterium]
QMHLALFPVDFLPNLRKDTAAFPLPYYSMLKAVSDFVGGNLSACKAEAFNVLRACYDTNLLHRYDKLRVVVDWRTHHVSANVLRLLGDAEELFTQGRATEAADKLRQAVLIAPEFAYPYYRLGTLYEQSGDSALAIGSYQQATTFDTLFLSAYLECYNLERAGSNSQSAVDVMSTALRRGNDYWVTNFDLGEALLETGEPRRAIKPFRRALELSPQSYETCIQTGKAYQAAKDFTSAREFFNKAIEIDALRQEAVEALNRLNEVEHARR